MTANRRVRVALAAVVAVASATVTAVGLPGAGMPTPAAAASAAAAGAAAVAPLGTGPTFDLSDGVVRATFRETTAGAAFAAVSVGTRMVVVAGTADGDFALHREVPHVNDGFGGDGQTTTDFGADNDVAYGVASGTDRSITAVGSSAGNVAVARYTEWGRLDWSFSGDGMLTRDLGAADDAAYGVVASDDGSALVAGGNGTAAAVLKMRADGTLDSGFGADGVVAQNAPGPWRAAAAASDGTLLVAGGGNGLSVARLSSTTGAPVTSFGPGGAVTLLAGAGAAARALAVQPDGRILVGGTSGGEAVVVRLLDTGVPDPTFGVGGVARFPSAGTAVASAVGVTSDGRVLLAGERTDGRGFVGRLTALGVPDASFGSSGVGGPQSGAPLRALAPWYTDGTWLTVGSTGDQFAVGMVSTNGTVATWPITFSQRPHAGRDLAVQPDGKVVVAGSVGGDLAVARFFQDGSRDPSFGRGGFAVYDAVESAYAVVVQASGRIVVAGRDRYDPVVVGLRPDGSIDRSFGDGGRVRIVTEPETGLPQALAVHSDGKIILSAAGGNGALLARFDAEGHLDPTFGSGGILRGAFGDRWPSVPVALAVQPDGRILATGADVRIRRLLPNGALDTTFGNQGMADFDADFELASNGRKAVLVLPDGKILVGGALWPGCSAASVIRLNPDGSRDASWQGGVSPQILINGALCGGSVAADSLAVDSEGRVLAFNGNLARFLPDGRPDPTLGEGGVLTQTGLNSLGPGSGLVPTPDGNVILAGTGDATFVLSRVLTGPAWAAQRVTATPLAGAARVTWDPPPPIAPRRIDAFLVSASDGEHSVTTPDADSRSAVVKGLKQGVTYTFTVRAVTPSGNGPLSAASNAITTSTTSRSHGFGWNGVGQVGDGTTTERHAPSTVAGLTGVIAVAAGTHHNLALRGDGTVWAWGWNAAGQLGDGTTTDRAAPVPVPGMSNVVAVAAGVLHSVAVKADGSVWTWGWNGVGQLGDATHTDRHLPVRVVGLSGVKAVAAGAHHNLAVRVDGTVWTWGWNAVGMLGDGSTVDRAVPVQAAGLPAVASVAGGWYHSVALAADGGVWTWGWNGAGQLVTNNTVDSYRPVLAYWPGFVASVAAGAAHTLLLMKDGHVLGWGWNGQGQIRAGAGEVLPRNDIVALPPGSRATAVSAGLYHSAAVLEDGTVWTWGWNGSGQLGVPGTAELSLPVKVNGTGLALAVAAGGLHTIVV